MLILIAIMVGIGLGKWLIYTGLLWLMIKIQTLNYNVLGLFASSLLATALGYIPVVGQYVGWAVLIICLWKCTGADISPDVLFTVGVAGALMFCVNLFVIGALMGSLMLAGPMIAGIDGDLSDDTTLAKDSSDEELDELEESEETTNVVRLAGTPWRTNSVATKTKPSLAKNSVTAAPATATVSSGEGRALAKQLTLKGVGVNKMGKSALIASGKQIYTVGLGEQLSVAGGSGTVTLICEDISQTSVTLAMERGEKIRVGFQ